MVNIQDLPAELLNLILSFLAYPAPPRGDRHAKAKDGTANPLERSIDSDQHLLDVCLVSRKFRDLAQPLLYHHFDDVGLAGDLSKTVLFARTIYRRPDLGEHVQDICFLPIPIGLGGPMGLTAEDLEFFKGVILDLRLGDQEKTWISAMEKSDLSVFAALLVNRTPNLRDLTLPGGQLFMKPLTRLFSRNPSFLPNLESIWFESEGELPGYDIASYQEFLTLPKLKFPTFEYGNLVDSSFPFTWAPGTLATEDVAFHHCYIDAGALKKFMQACKSLKSFVCQNFSLDPRDQRAPSLRAVPEFNAAQAQEAALLHRDTLEHFHVEFARGPWEIQNVEEYNSSCVKVGSFRDFSVLEVIMLPHAVLPPHPQFPRSLKMLHITDCNSSIREIAGNIATDCKNGLYPHFTDFKVLTIDVTAPIKLPGQRIPPGKSPEQCFHDIRNLFKGTSVDFAIAPYQMPDFDEYDEDSDFGYEEDVDYDEYPPLGEGPRIFDLIMERALQDPDFAHLR
ncbi:hypothetical protein PHISCL_03355 [Aspergillus sclerotialis]|uniref:Uncharacterized protein n=1 Tax=Aspergillus sclerotialis TaxID=2070753 RepID=A0A3A2ZNU4_9EURO|nr:hypothetical protein PHISCL_03355 [Aspergillus sclerotialis]